MYSPFNPSVSILSEQLRLNSYRIGMSNIAFTAFHMMLGICSAYLLHTFSEKLKIFFLQIKRGILYNNFMLEKNIRKSACE